MSTHIYLIIEKKIDFLSFLCICLILFIDLRIFLLCILFFIKNVKTSVHQNHNILCELCATNETTICFNSTKAYNKWLKWRIAARIHTYTDTHAYFGHTCVYTTMWLVSLRDVTQGRFRPVIVTSAVRWSLALFSPFFL